LRGFKSAGGENVGIFVVGNQVESLCLSKSKSRPRVAKLPPNRCISIAFLPTRLYLIFDFEYRDFGDRHPFGELTWLIGDRKDFLSELISCAVGISRLAFDDRAQFVFAVIIQ
jgi:hypothetical protein